MLHDFQNADIIVQGMIVFTLVLMVAAIFAGIMATKTNK